MDSERANHGSTKIKSPKKQPNTDPVSPHSPVHKGSLASKEPTGYLDIIDNKNKVLK